MKQADKKAMQKTLTNLFKLAKELGNSDIPILWELGYYLVDNLILKICMYVAKEKNEEEKIFKSPNKDKTKDFPKLYKEILEIHYPSIPDYDNDVEPHHNRRNIFQHSQVSIELSIRKEFVVPYLDLAEEIMKICGIIDAGTVISLISLRISQIC